MPIPTPFVTMTHPRDAEFTFRLPGKTISVVKHGQATVVTPTFDDIGAGHSKVRNADATPGDVSPAGGAAGQEPVLCYP